MTREKLELILQNRKKWLNNDEGELITDRWPIVYTKNKLFIGCQQHTITEWFNFSDKEISKMHEDALEWWKKWKPIIKDALNNLGIEIKD